MKSLSIKVFAYAILLIPFVTFASTTNISKVVFTTDSQTGLSKV